ncbi:MAG: hypothetical protein HY060_26525 [Proteobacteria bacterium]|nr:hypothetical protein [Pseudomonadota bacterium]
MKKLLAAVAISALALTSVVPMVQAAERTAGIHKAEKPGVHKVAAKKKAKSTKPTGKKKVTKKA